MSSVTECKEAESTPYHHGLSVEEIPANVAPLISSENSYQPRIFKALSSKPQELETRVACVASADVKPVS
ncbi:MAG: hypothetical protein NTU48_02645 [Legionellales bacterium]|nr:hypothetical protein [Legionellales bacterium]